MDLRSYPPRVAAIATALVISMMVTACSTPSRDRQDPETPDARAFAREVARDVVVDFEQIERPERALPSQLVDAVISGTVTDVAGGVVVNVLNPGGGQSLPSDHPDVLDGGSAKPLPAVQPWLVHTMLSVRIHQAAVGPGDNSPGLAGQLVQVQVLSGDHTTIESRNSLIGTQVVMGLVRFAPYGAEPELYRVDLPEGVRSLEDGWTTVPDITWFSGSDTTPVSPFLSIDELPVGWGAPRALNDIARAFGVAADSNGGSS